MGKIASVSTTFEVQCLDDKVEKRIFQRYDDVGV